MTHLVAQVYLFAFVLFFFKMGLHYVALAVLDLTLQTRLAWNSQRSTGFCILSAEIKGI